MHVTPLVHYLIYQVFLPKIQHRAFLVDPIPAKHFKVKGEMVVKRRNVWLGANNFLWEKSNFLHFDMDYKDVVQTSLDVVKHQ